MHLIVPTNYNVPFDKLVSFKPAKTKMLAKLKNSKDNQFEITHENGATYLSCSAIDGGKPFLTVKLLITDEDQGHFIREKFLENPSAIYSKIIEMLTQ